MTTYIESTDAANMVRADLRYLRNRVISYQKQAVVEDSDLAHWEASLLTETADGLLVRVRELEAALIDWQERWPDEHDETDCDGDCPRDHDAEARDTVRETIWEQQRDEAA